MMTTDTRTTRRGRPWQMLLLLALLAWLVPQGALATHVDDTWKYQVALNGANTVRIQVPDYFQGRPLDRYRLSRASEEELLDHAHPRPLHDHRLQHLRIHLPSDAPPARAIGLRPGHRLPRGGCRVVHNMV